MREASQNIIIVLLYLSASVKTIFTVHNIDYSQYKITRHVTLLTGVERGCPADSVSLGRGSWRLLHTIAANYPEQPTLQEKNDMSSFIVLFSKVYPCVPCAEDFRDW